MEEVANTILAKEAEAEEEELTKKQKKKAKGLRLLSPEIRLSTRIQKEIISLVLPTEKTPIPIIPPVIVCVETALHQFTLYALYLSVHSTCSMIASIVS